MFLVRPLVCPHTGTQDTQNVFGGPAAEAKLRANPKTRAYLDDPLFMVKLRNIQENPGMMMKHMQDPRIMEALGVITGLNFSTFDRGE